MDAHPGVRGTRLFCECPGLDGYALANDFDLNYSFFVLKGIDWNDSRARFRSQLVSTSGDTELFIDFIIGQLSGIRALIVDLRSNGGGNDLNGKDIAARFADLTRLFIRVRFRDGPNHGDFGPFIDDSITPGGAQSFQGPIAMLTNRGTVSAAESLVLAFAVLPNATSFGDFTGGGSGNPAQQTLANGWQYSVSRWIAFRPNGTTFEGVGLQPDVRVDIAAVDAAALQDTIVDRAIADLRVAIP